MPACVAAGLLSDCATGATAGGAAGPMTRKQWSVQAAGRLWAPSLSVYERFMTRSSTCARGRVLMSLRFRCWHDREISGR